MEKLLVAASPLIIVLFILSCLGVAIWFEKVTGIFGLPVALVFGALVMGVFIYFAA